MKFKKSVGCRTLTHTDSSGDKLAFVHYTDDNSKVLWVSVERSEGTSSIGVKLTKSKAIKLAWAILDELDPFGPR